MRPLLALIIILMGSSIFLSNCIKPPVYSTEPEIEFKSISKTLVKGLPNIEPDSIVFTLKFTDGDGDLGIKNEDTNSCTVGDSISFEQIGCNAYMVDSRTGYVYPYRIPYVSPKGNIKAISGEVQIVRYAPFFCTNFIPGTKDTMFFNIQIKDRAGNLSNVIRSPDIIIECD